MTEHDRRTAPSYALREHNLDFIPDLRVGEELFTRRFSSGCSMAHCTAYCCREGVIVDVQHRDRVLAEAALVERYMDATQEHDCTKWFDTLEEDDPDFPSGRVTTTRVLNGTCVFLDSNRRCVLHVAEAESPGLKPFYCRTYPIVIIDGRLTLDDMHCPDETQCCGPVDGGTVSILDLCAWELEYTLGERAKGMAELRRVEQEALGRRNGNGHP